MNKIFEELEKIAAIIPYPLYWTDTHAVVLGANEVILNAVGGSKDTIIGKTPEEFYGPEVGKVIKQNCIDVMHQRKVMFHEESIRDITTGKIKFFTGVRGPIFDNEGNVIGIIGTSIEITAQKESQKEAENLKIENAEQKVHLQEQERFTQIANQLSHDIRSPLAAAKIWYESIRAKLTEEERVMGRNALERAVDIVNSGFIRYKPKTGEKEKSAEEKQPVMIFTTLEQVFSEKRLEYQQEPVTLEKSFDLSAVFAFIEVKPSAFKRMFSNLINNAADALEGHPDGKVCVSLKAEEKFITLTVADNGNGMSDEIKEKILNNTAVTAGKKHGNGIGFTQIWDTLKDGGGKLSIESAVGAGTKVHLLFPRIAAPAWVVEEIILSAGDVVVVVDDDPSIHDAWKSRFQPHSSLVRLVHFEEGEQAIAFLQSFTQKENILLLTDYELLNQSVNGLHIIEKTGIKRTILVTSRSGDEEIQQKALTLNTQILPKQLAVNTPIILQKGQASFEFLPTEVVVMDDDSLMLENLVALVFAKKKVDAYKRPQDCLAKIQQYKKNTLFFIDYHYGANTINGVDVAKQLHQNGFAQLYLLTGDTIDLPPEIQQFLTVILKTDIEKLKLIVETGEKKTATHTSPDQEIISLPTSSREQISFPKDKTMLNLLLHHLSHEVFNNLSVIQMNAGLIDLIESSEDKQFSDIKEEVLDRVKAIGYSSKKCSQILGMELTKLHVMFDGITSAKRETHHIKDTIQLALAEYVFQESEKQRLHYSDTVSFDYHAEEGMIKQMLFHVFQQGLQAVQKEPTYTIEIYCLSEPEKQYNTLIISYPGGSLLNLPTKDVLLTEDAFPLNTKLCWFFCQNVMQSLGGYIEERLLHERYEMVFYFPI